MIDDFEETLIHFGVKGMKWGVRKDRENFSLNMPKNVIIRLDGSIDIKPGANLQRLIRSNGQSKPLSDITYASINEYDNARYIKAIGQPGFLGGGRDQILRLSASAPIKAPSKVEATKIVSDLLINDKEFRNRNRDLLDRSISEKELRQIQEEPSGKTAKIWYEMTNQKLTFSEEDDANAPFIQKKVKETLDAKGYNALRDENDFLGGLSKAPIIIFSPEKTLKITSVVDITDELRSANKAQLKRYKKMGKQAVENALYQAVEEKGKT